MEIFLSMKVKMRGIPKCPRHLENFVILKCFVEEFSFVVAAMQN